MILIIILSALAYFLVAGLVTGLLNKVMPMDDLDDVTGLAIVFGIIRPLLTRRKWHAGKESLRTTHI